MLQRLTYWRISFVVFCSYVATTLVWRLLALSAARCQTLVNYKVFSLLIGGL